MYVFFLLCKAPRVKLFRIDAIQTLYIILIIIFYTDIEFYWIHIYETICKIWVSLALWYILKTEDQIPD